MNTPESIELLLKLSQAGANIATMLAQRGSPAHKLGISMQADLQLLYDKTLGLELSEERKVYMDREREFHERRTRRLMEQVGPKLWEKFHRDALTAKNRAEAWAQIEALLASIPCGECKASFRQIVSENLHHGHGEFFEHTVLLHNLVNRKLGKPEFTVEQARALYQ